MKLFYLTDLLSPYRIEWMNLLSEHYQISAFYVHETESTRDSKWLSSLEPLFQPGKVPTSALSAQLPSREFLSFLRKERFDIYVVDGYSSLLKLRVIRLLLKSGCRLFINIDGIDVWRKKSRSDFIKDRIKRRVFRSNACFLCGSSRAAETIIQNGADQKRVFTHPFTSLHEKDILSFEQKKQLQQQYKRALNKEDRKIVLAVGRFIPLKRYDVLIRAWKDMPDDCFLYLIGGGEKRKNYEQMIQKLNVKNIELINFILPEKLSEYYCAADLFVHTSSTETWGLVFNEAMAKGCPVIATDRCVGAVELIRSEKEGYLTQVGDAEELSKKMLTVLEDDALRDQMAQNAIKRIMPYTYENLAAVHLRIFRDTAAESTL